MCGLLILHVFASMLLCVANGVCVGSMWWCGFVTGLWRFMSVSLGIVYMSLYVCDWDCVCVCVCVCVCWIMSVFVNVGRPL